MLGKYKYLILTLAVIILLAPKPALALWGVGDFGLFDIPDQILGGLEERTGPIFTAVLSIFFVYIAGLAGLALSSKYLTTFIVTQGDAIATLRPMTEAAWGFTAGLANMLLIIIFLVIAFAFIFKIETFQAKKALPKLIMVALLLNFSLLFVEMLIDISQVLYNTVLPDASFFNTVTGVLILPGESIVGTVITWIVAMGVAWAIPMVNAFAQITFSALFTVFILPNLILWAIQGIFFWLLALMFFSFVFLFAARVFVLQILMILSPLAFVCLILPKTEKFWQQWFDTLIQWLLLGVFFLFFLVLGFGTLSLLTPSVDPVGIPGVTGFKLGGYLLYYFVVFIYMAVLLFVGKKFIPSGAQALIDFGKGIAGTVVTRGLKPIGKGALYETQQTRLKQQQKAGERAGRIEQKIKSSGMASLTRGEKITAWNLRRKGRGDLSAGVALTKATAGEAQRRLINEQKRKLSAKTKGLDEEGQKAFYQKEVLKTSMSPKTLRNAHARTALMELAADADAIDGDDNRIKALADEAVQIGGKTTAKKVYSRNPHWAPDGDASEEGTFQNIIATINPSDIDKLNKAAKLNERVIREIVNTKQENLINRLGGQSKMARDKVQIEIDKTTGEDGWEDKVNSLISKGEIQEAKKVLHLLRNFHTSQAATNIGWKQYGTVEEIDNKDREISAKSTPLKRKVTLPGEEGFKETEKKIREDLEK
ncbi:MAG: hypothetical protein COS25_00330 [Candidatus Nealsonbacteria bacterium CG02_land_8_20_14_3_00_37_10]|uniref:Uncharacterized protein n=1 Tax=Candidatus Nealsonbacteria bacterium CG02_land_8_20_14_3_00_37_10 TaxID=1974699 RepID=A0A2M7DA88_9BACT|nr:MAG: hypothetical protein COS25_00330 [Candidatus Nealsonbacteria bacterium CG02_land_8_20_14_3_00_37_10]